MGVGKTRIKANWFLFLTGCDKDLIFFFPHTENQSPRTNRKDCFSPLICNSLCVVYWVSSNGGLFLGPLSAPFVCFSNLYCFNYWSFTGFWYSLIENLFSVQETRDVGLIAGWEDPLSRKWQPAPVFLPGKLHLQRNLVGYSPWSDNESSMIEQHTRWFDNFSNVVLQEHLDDFGLFYFVSLVQFF